MIRSEAEYQRTREYVDKLQQILLGLRRTHTPSQFEAMSRAYVTELAKAQREITLYLAMPDVPEQKAA